MILHFVKLSISINGYATGFFNCKRGVRQGDPLSPLLFCLAEEILSRGISKLVESGQLQLMTGPRDFRMPSHVLYADDIMVVCRASKNILSNLLNLFKAYEQASGPVISKDKSKFFLGSSLQNRSARISDI